MDKPTHLLWQKKRKDYKDLHKVDNRAPSQNILTFVEN